MTLAILLAAACGPAKSGRPDTTAASKAAATNSGVPRFTKAQFASLRWLDGQWRGAGPDGKPFFESYRVVDDSTMHQGTFSDSTFKTQTDSAIIAWRNGVVVDQGTGSPWAATHLDSTMVSFALTKAPANRFVWIRHSTDQWETQIYTPDRQGHEQRAVYLVHRVR